jgi:hypothetical protein
MEPRIVTGVIEFYDHASDEAMDRLLREFFLTEKEFVMSYERTLDAVRTEMSADHSSASLQQLLAASALLVSAERIASSGVLSVDEEQELRLLIVRVCNAFQIPTIAERPLDGEAA